MIEKNKILIGIIPETPKITPKEQIYVYVPIVTSKSPGIAKFNEHFDISQDGTVSLHNDLEIKIDKLIINGNGTKYLSDNGEYKEIDLTEYQKKTDNRLNTTSKGIVGAINEVNEKVNGAVLMGNSAPTTSTKGIIGSLYIDLTDVKLYVCTNVSSNNYTWQLIIANGETPSPDVGELIFTEQSEGVYVLTLENGTLTFEDDGQGNVEIKPSSGTLTFADDGNGNVTMSSKG